MKLVPNGPSYLRCAYTPPKMPADFVPDEDLADFAFGHLHITMSMDAAGVFILCPTCRGHRMQMTILRHPPKDDFYGFVNTTCADCKHEFTPLERSIRGMRLMRPKTIVCKCKSKDFLFFHAKSATNGFFEEEAIGGRCAQCETLVHVLKAD